MRRISLYIALFTATIGLACISMLFNEKLEFERNSQDFEYSETEQTETTTEEETETAIISFVFETELVEALPRATEEQTTEQSTTVFETEEETQPEHILPEKHTVTDCMMNADLQLWLLSYADQRNINPYLIIAICERESCCRQNIIGDNGNSYGIMQIQPRWQTERLNAYGLTADDLLNAQNCIMVGIDILQEYFDKGYSLEYVLMCYNGGEDYASRQTQVSEYAVWVINRTNELQSQGIY